MIVILPFLKPSPYECEALVETYAEHNRVKEVTANANYVAELRNQISKAQQRGSQSDAARFQSLLDSASSQ
jgi:hypothetical protein